MVDLKGRWAYVRGKQPRDRGDKLQASPTSTVPSMSTKLLPRPKRLAYPVPGPVLSAGWGPKRKSAVVLPL